MTLDQAKKLKPGDEIRFNSSYFGYLGFFVGLTQNNRVVYENALTQAIQTVLAEDVVLPEPVYEWRWVYTNEKNDLYVTSNYYTEIEANSVLSCCQRIDSTKRLRGTE